MESLSDLQARISELRFEQEELQEKLFQLSKLKFEEIPEPLQLSKLKLEQKELHEKLVQLKRALDKLYFEFYKRGGKFSDIDSDDESDAEYEEGGGSDDR